MEGFLEAEGLVLGGGDRRAVSPGKSLPRKVLHGLRASAKSGVPQPEVNSCQAQGHAAPTCKSTGSGVGMVCGGRG